MSGATLERKPFQVRRPAELENRPTAASWLVETLWADEGVGIIGGTPKSYKTWLGLDLAVSVASETPALGHFAVLRPGPALVYLAEDAASALRVRLNALCDARGLALEKLDVLTITTPTLRLDREIDLERLTRTVERHRPRMLLLDPFVRLHSADENSAQEVARILAGLRDLQRKHRVAVVVVHHTRKNRRGVQPGQALRGSGDFHAWADSGLYLAHIRGKLRITIEHRSAPAPEPRYIKLVQDPPHLVLDDPPTRGPSLQERVIDILRASPRPTTRTELRKRLAVQNARLGAALNALEELGRIRRTTKGVVACIAESEEIATK